ncbi:MAG: T9SS type A sorting domain-containing protein, partial [Bacteroidota bacterium]
GGYGNGDTIITSLVFSGNNLFAGTFSFGVFLSTNNGMSWTQVNNGLTDTSIYALAVLDTNIFAGTYGNGVFLSTNNGTSWTNAGLLNEDVEALAISGTNLFAGTNGDGGVYLSTNNGKNWSVVGSGLINKTVYSFAVSDTNIYIGTFQGVCLSTNNGTSWNGIDFSDMSRPIFSLTISGKNLFAETDEGLWRQWLRDITSVNVRKTEIPSVFSLSQNYPNPFNPMTTISFSLPSKSFVSLKVFDIIGREVVTIVSGEMSAGNYTRQWNATKMASGIYFYRLHAGSYSETK